MKHIIPTKEKLEIKNSTHYLHGKVQQWISEIEFIKIEQHFLKELLGSHVLELCQEDKFQSAKLFLKGLEHEEGLGKELIVAMNEHRMNLGLLIEQVHLKKEDLFRKTHEQLKIEMKDYVHNFKYLKEQVFELILVIMRKDKKQKLLTS